MSACGNSGSTAREFNYVHTWCFDIISLTGDIEAAAASSWSGDSSTQTWLREASNDLFNQSKPAGQSAMSTNLQAVSSL
jgi:hypothetical protein